jgi:hypothetical protein
MRYCAAFLFVMLLLQSCGEEKVSLSGDAPVKMNDFIAGFTAIKLPLVVSDTNAKKLSDTTLISYKIFTQFVPDSILGKYFGKEKKLTIHPIGKYALKEKETYLVANVSNKNKLVTYLIVFNEQQQFSAAMALYNSSDNKKFAYTASLDKRLTINLNKEYYTTDNQLLYYRTSYAYNNAGLFTVVLTETNDQTGVADVLMNPIDTLPKKNKFSGDYVKDKKNMISLRDGRDANTYTFFIHFEKGQDCTGELKGELSMLSPTKGQFKENDSPCVIDFNFSSNRIEMKEQGACGSYRGIKCFFNDSYPKKKEPKTTTKKSR